MPNVFLPFFPFVNGTIISADEMNADLAALRDGTLSITGDTMNGSLIFNPDNLYDIGEPADHRPRSIYSGTSMVSPEFHATTAMYTPTLAASVNIATPTLSASNGITTLLLEATTVEAAHLFSDDLVLTAGMQAVDYYGGTFHGIFIGDGTGITNILHPSDTPTITGSWVFTGNPSITLQSATPLLYWHETDQAPNNKLWRVGLEGSGFYIQATDDLGAVSSSGLVLERSGANVTRCWLGGQTAIVPQGAETPLKLGVAFRNDEDTGWTNLAANSIEVWLGGGEAMVWRTDGVAPNNGTSVAVRGMTGTSSVEINSGHPLQPAWLAVGGSNYGTGTGSFVRLGHNENGTTPAAGYLEFVMRTSETRKLWVDTAGMLRIHTVAPSGSAATDTLGVIVGTQSSTAAVKDILGLGIAPFEALQKVVETPVYHFRYLEGFPGEEFDGIVTDDAPHFGMDHGKSLNTINAIGYLIQAIKALHREIAILKGEGVVHA